MTKQGSDGFGPGFEGDNTPGFTMKGFDSSSSSDEED